MLYIALCDDNKRDLDLLTGYLTELRREHLHFEDISFLDGSELVAQYQNGHRFSLVILDMLMEPLSGIETAKGIRQYDSDVPILIVTSTPEYAIEGYKVNASRYILKPVEKKSFLREVQEVLERVQQTKSHYYSVHCDSGIIKIEIEKICFFESQARTITLHAAAAAHTFSGSLREVEGQLAPYDFVRVHKSYVVNLKNIHRIFKDVITMVDGSEVPLSKNRSKAIHQRLLEYMETSL